jgi:hypothetical protein
MNVRVQRVVVRTAGDSQAGARLAERLPTALGTLLATNEVQSQRDVERLVRLAAREVERR